MRQPPDVDQLFRQGAVHAWSSGARSRLEVVRVGRLTVPTGRIIARDPYLWIDDGAGERERLAVEFQPGSYPASVSVLTWERNSDEEVSEPRRRSVAGVELLIENSPASDWRLGVTREQDTSRLAANEYFGFGVDAGVGCLLDVSQLPALRRLQDEWSPLEEITDRLTQTDAELVERYGAEGGILFFNCGMGDGVYPTWIGVDRRGRPVRLVVDLEILDGGIRVH